MIKQHKTHDEMVEFLIRETKEYVGLISKLESLNDMPYGELIRSYHVGFMVGLRATGYGTKEVNSIFDKTMEVLDVWLDKVLDGTEEL